MSTSEVQTRFVTPPADVNDVHDLLDGLWADVPDVSPLDRMAFETALSELVSNVIQHADAGNGVTCTLHIVADEGGVRAVLSDSAESGGVVMRDFKMPDEEAESGRGLAMIQALVDDFSYERRAERNVWTIERRRSEGGA
jgi:serine/threonine-protein kinase RsbW